MLNTSITGVRYGVIACNSLDSDLEHELFYGTDARDVSYFDARQEEESRISNEICEICDDAENAAAEVDGLMTEADHAAFVADHVEASFERMGFTDADDYREHRLSVFNEDYEDSEPVIEGRYEGIDYRIQWLGGAPLLWVIAGPEGYARSLCSPCVPNAADLDSGFVLDSEIPRDSSGFPTEDPENPYLCYCVPRDWLNKEL